MIRGAALLLYCCLVLGSFASASSVDEKHLAPSGTSDEDVRADECASDGGTDPGRPEEGAGTAAPEDDDDDDEDEWCDECDWTEIVEALGCTGIVHRPVPTDAEFLVMRRAYETAVGAEDSSLSPVVGGHAFVVPHRAGPAAGGKGRGIFAAAPVAQGAPVWTARQMATFYDAYQFRAFLGAIPVDNACDVLYWAYSHTDEDNGKPRVSVELDHTALCNDAGEDGEKNVGCDMAAAARHGDGDCEQAYALRDIQVGEEFLCRYTDFSAGEDGWEAFGI